MRRAVVLALFLAFIRFAAAQDSIRWKWNRSPDLLKAPLKQTDPLRSHFAIEFGRSPSSADIDQLRERGAIVLRPLSHRALIISVPRGFVMPEHATLLGSFAAADKISPRIHAAFAAGPRAQQDPNFVIE